MNNGERCRVVARHDMIQWLEAGQHFISPLGVTSCLTRGLPDFAYGAIKLLSITFAFIFLAPNQIKGQKTEIHGTVLHSETSEPIPFVNVAFKGSRVGTITDSTGAFYLETGRKFDSLQVSFVGFHSQSFVVESGVTDELDIKLLPASFELGMVTIGPGENLAWPILRKVIANKPINTPDRLDSYEYEAYHKVRFDLNNFTDKMKNNVLLTPFKYIWDNTDTAEDGIKFLPILLTESNEDHLYRKNPLLRKKIIKGQRTFKFFKAPGIMEFVKDMYIDPNIYDNYVVILDRSFPSPINDRYKRNYNFILLDSLVNVNGNSCYRIAFKPKGRSDVAFKGEMFIDDETYAVVQADLEFSIEANINFVRNYWIRQEYSKVEDTQWFLTKSAVLGDFTVVENSKEMTGFYGRKNTEFRKIKINQLPKEKAFSNIDPVVFEDSALIRDEVFWTMARGDTFNLQEQKLIGMVDRMNHDPGWKRFVGGMKLIFEGWLPLGKFDLGNVFTFYSHNQIEGSRVKLGFRTTDKLHRNVSFSGYGAYGFRDKRFKGGGHAEFIFARNQNRLMRVGAKYRNDLFQQGRSENMMPLDHFLTSFARISGAQKRTMAETYSAYLERQWFTGFSTRLSAFRNNYESLDGGFASSVGTDTSYTSNHTAGGIKLNIRFAWGDSDLPATYSAEKRGLFASDYPMLSFEMASGFKGLFGGQFNYQHFKLKLEYQLRANKWGHLDILTEGGLINGKLPHTLLYVPNGNPLVFNDDNAFNLMNYMEFVSDRYVSLQLEHHFDGLLFNLIPGVRKLKLRSFLIGKMHYGVLSQSNLTSEYQRPDGMESMTVPYAEVGFGIENILKIARIDFTWRITHLDNANTLKFIVKPSFYFRF
ncbi:MAG: hypothetical protein ACI9FU_001457 [Granulosicoccus sp.]